MTGRKFTFLELLIVVAIIGILISILLPSLSKAKKKAIVAVCASNQAQANRGFMGYTKSNDGRLPPGERSIYNNSWNWKHSWDDQIHEYLGIELTKAEIDNYFYSNEKDIGVLKCPEEPSDINRRGLTGKVAAIRSYHSNSYKIWFEQGQNYNQGINNLKNIKTGLIGRMVSRHLAEVENTANTYLISEGFQGLAGDGGWSAMARDNDRYSTSNFYKHHVNNSRNYLMLDGSVSFLPNKKMYDDSILDITR